MSGKNQATPYRTFDPPPKSFGPHTAGNDSLLRYGLPRRPEPDRAPPSTEISQPESENLHRSVCWTSGVEVEQVPGFADSVVGDGLAIGQTLSGRYRIERELGEGGVGVVYLVTDEQVAGETFAVKVLKERLDAETLSLLRGEVCETRRLSHPNIIDVHSVNVDGRRLYLLMEYLEGKSLDKLLDEEFGRGMSFSHAWPIIEDVGAALGNAHDHNVIHSDLKPSNVFLTTSRRAKLLDFGIARVWRGRLLHTRSGPRALTPAYASCEMLEGKDPDRRDDVYSFACVIYEMLCGERPFGELTALEAREGAAQMPLLQELSREQNAALAKALAFDRTERTASVEEFLAGFVADNRPRGRQPRVLAIASIVAVVALALGYMVLDKLWISRPSAAVQSAAPDALPAMSGVAATPVAFKPPPQSIAVLPFVNMSGDKEQEYFSEGLTEELLNSLSRIGTLQVAARTSSFSFQGEHPDIATVAHKLNVGAVLEGSVRRSAHTVRITAQLVDGVTGFRLWSQTYDRDLGDVLKLQTEIATSVASALKVSLVGDEWAKIEFGGTRNPAAYDAYLRGSNAYWTWPHNENTPIVAFTEAIRLDPGYALAYAARSIAETVQARTATSPAGFLDKARLDARKAIELAPALGEGHLALAGIYADLLAFGAANEEYERALALAPGNTRVLRDYGSFAGRIGRGDSGLAMVRRAVALDPLNPVSHGYLGESLNYLRRGAEAIAAFAHAEALKPGCCSPGIGSAYYLMGDFESARSACEKPPADEVCLAVTYMKLGRHADAQAAMAKLRASEGDRAAYQYAEINAQWGNTSKALEWLETALRLHDVQLAFTKTDYLLDPVRQEPRFQVVLRKLKFPTN